MSHHSLIETLKRGLAILVSLCLLWTSGNIAQAAEIAPEAFAGVSNLPQFQLLPPARLGRITDYFNASEPRSAGASEPSSPTRRTTETPMRPLVILIQDLHAHYGVQKNISGILEFLSDKLAHSSPAEGGTIGPMRLWTDGAASSESKGCCRGGPKGGGGTSPLTDILSPQGARNVNRAPFALAVEGAEGPLDSSVLALFPDKKIKAQAADYLMREGELTGAEDFAVTRGIPDLLTGVENSQYYALNRELFRKTLADRQKLVGLLKGIQADIAPLQERIYGPALRDFQKKADAWDKGEMTTEEFIGFLVSMMSSSAAVSGGPINSRMDSRQEHSGLTALRDFPALATFAANARFGTMEQVRAATAQFFSGAAGYLSTEEKKNLSVLAKQTDATVYYLYLRELVYKHQLFLAAPPELAAYLEYLHTEQTMGMDRVTHEAKELAFRIKLQLAENVPSPQPSPEKGEGGIPSPFSGEGGRRPGEGSPAVDLVQVEHDLDLLARIADLQATEFEVKDFGPRLNQFVALCQSLMESNGIRSFDEAKVRGLISSSIDYYAMALMRNQPMIDNTLGLLKEANGATGNAQRATSPKTGKDPLPIAHGPLRPLPSVAVLVAGGFHTTPLTQLLRERNISYLVISPRVESLTDADHDLYIKRLSGNLLTVDDVLAADPSQFGAEPVSRLVQLFHELPLPSRGTIGRMRLWTDGTASSDKEAASGVWERGPSEAKGLAAGIFLASAGVGAVALTALARASAHGAALDLSHLMAALNHLTAIAPAWAYSAAQALGSVKGMLAAGTAVAAMAVNRPNGPDSIRVEDLRSTNGTRPLNPTVDQAGDVSIAAESERAALHADVNKAIETFRENGQVRPMPFFERLHAAWLIARAGEWKLGLRLALGFYSIRLYGDANTDELVAGQTTHAGISTGAIHLAMGEYLRLRALGDRSVAGRIAHEAKEISRWRQEARRRHQSRRTMRDWIKAHLPEARHLDKQIHSEGLSLERHIAQDPTVGTYEITEDPLDINIQAHQNSSAPRVPVTGQDRIPLIPFVAAMQTHTRAELAESIRNDSVADLIKRVSRKSLQSITGAYQALVYHQFMNQETRPIVELLLNAIDTEERYYYRQGDPDHEKNVYWTVVNGRTVVRDEGEGIGLEDLTKLLYPSEGGNLGQSGTTGRFGAGFLSILSYLNGGQNGQHRIVLKSVKGNERNRFEFDLDGEGNLTFSWTPLSAEDAVSLGGHGTEIEVVSSAIRRDALFAEARKTLGKKDDAAVWIQQSDGSVSRLNDPRMLRTIAELPMQNLDGERRNVRAAVALKVENDVPSTAMNDKTEIQILVNGVFFDSFEVETFNQPKRLILDFQKDLVDYARDRSALRPTKLTLEALDGMIRAMDASLLLAHAGLLFELASYFERRLPAFAKSPHLPMPTQTLKKRIDKELAHFPFAQKTVVAEDPQLQNAVDQDRSSLLFLPQALIPESARRRSLRERAGADSIVYLPFRTGADSFAVVTQESVMAVDDRLRSAIESPAKQAETLAILESIRTVSESAYSGASMPRLLAIPRQIQPPENRETAKSNDSLKLDKALLKLFRDYQRQATTLSDFFRIEMWIWFAQLGRDDENFSISLAPYLARAYGFSIHNDLHQVQPGIDELINSLRFAEDGRPIEPVLSEEAWTLVRSQGSHSVDDRNAMLNRAGDNLPLLKELLIGDVYEYMLEHYNDQFKQDTDEQLQNGIWAARTSITLVPNTVLHSLLQRAYQLRRGTDLNFLDAILLLIREKHPTFTFSFDSIDKIRVPRELARSLGMAWAKSLPEPAYLQNLSWFSKRSVTNVYLSIVVALIEKWKVTPDQADLMMKAFAVAESILEETFSDLSDEEIQEIAMNSSFSRLQSMRQKNIVQALETPGKLHAKLLPQLFLHFADTPSVGKMPARSIPSPSGNGVSLPLSNLIYAQAQAEHSLEDVRNLADLSHYLADGRAAPRSQELQERAQTAIKRAYEQTTDGLAFLREMATNAYEASRSASSAGRRVFRVSSWIDPEKRFVLSMEDQGIGMTLQDVIGNLLQPNVSEWNLEFRHFGQGFFTLFRSADQVRVQTTRDGMTTLAHLGIASK